MKLRFFLVFCVSFFCYKAQVNLQGIIKDSKTKEAIPYCAVAVKNSTKGCLSNEEGLFQISARVEIDTLLINVIGYSQKKVALSEFVKDPIIYLNKKGTSLDEVVIYSNNDYLYTLFDKSREKLLKSTQTEAKAYFVLETELANQPVELMESYYFASLNNAVVKELRFKNGRVGIASYNERFFMSQNISKAFTFLNLTSSETYLPGIPLQCTLRKLKKLYYLKLKSINDKENPVYQITFTPKDTAGSFFSGELWIEKLSGDLKKITLSVYNTKHHPFLPIVKEFGEIKNASMQIIKTYALQNGENKVSHIDFNYQLNYEHHHANSLLNANPDTLLEVKSKGLLYFYDYGNPFISPYFTYDAELSDYRKISFLSYNESFWAANTTLLYSEKMKKGISYFRNNGQLINYKTRSLNKDKNIQKSTFAYETNYVEWSAEKRILLKKDRIKNDTLSTQANSYVNGFRTHSYNLKAQIFMDVNPMKDSIQHYSISIFDVYQTFYNLPEETFTNCFLNIYFDLVEIERRRMEKIISTNKFSLAEFDSIYKKNNEELNEQTAHYFREVERGKKFKALKKWNDLVKQNLGIDNCLIFEVNETSK